MWTRAALFAVVASALPLAAGAQQPPPDGSGPPPDVRAKMDAARSNAKTAAFAALSADHRAKVQAIVDAFDATGSTLTVAAASSQIDAILDKNESAAALAQEKQMREAMRAAYQAGGDAAPGGDAGPGGGPPGGPGGMGGGPPGGMGGGFGGGGGFGRGGGFRHRSEDAGRFLLSIDADPEKYRAAMEAERAARADHPPAQ